MATIRRRSPTTPTDRRIDRSPHHHVGAHPGVDQADEVVRAPREALHDQGPTERRETGRAEDLRSWGIGMGINGKHSGAKSNPSGMLRSGRTNAELRHFCERVELATGVDDLDRLAPSDRRAAGLEPPVVSPKSTGLGPRRTRKRGRAVADAGAGPDGQVETDRFASIFDGYFVARLGRSADNGASVSAASASPAATILLYMSIPFCWRERAAAPSENGRTSAVVFVRPLLHFNWQNLC